MTQPEPLFSTAWERDDYERQKRGEAPLGPMSQPAANTNRELYREPDHGNGAFYSDSIHVTERGGIGINCGGTVYVKPLREWWKMAAAPEAYANVMLSEENDRLYEDGKLLRAAMQHLLICGNHIATHRTDRWPDYKLDGLTREQQVENALRVLGATQDYDMWCCWSGMMQTRDELEQSLLEPLDGAR